MGEPVVAALPAPGNVVFDVDGCLVVSGRPLPGAREALMAVEAAGARVLVATNNSTRTPDSVAERLGDLLGMTIDPIGVMTSALAAAAVLGADDGPVLVIGEDGLHAAVRGRDIATTDDPDAARTVLVGLDRRFDYDAMRRATHAVSLGARLVATNDDRTFPSLGPDAPGAGAILASIEAATGRRAEVCGKPHRPMLAALDPLLAPGSTWMVGDRLETDIAFARAGGFVAVLVLTGVTAAGDDLGVWSPDLILPTVGDLVPLLGQ